VTPDALVGLLAESDRLKVFAAVVLGAETPSRIRELTALDERVIGQALRRLAAGGLITDTGTGYRPQLDGIKEAARRDPAEQEDHGYADRRTESVIRTFVRSGRLLDLPAQPSRRRIVLEHIAQVFEPGVHYPESQVNAALQPWCAGGVTDHVTLRRYLIDAGLLSRRGNDYWRSGGWVDLDGG
jgi:hypothetical protein